MAVLGVTLVAPLLIQDDHNITSEDLWKVLADYWPPYASDAERYRTETALTKGITSSYSKAILAGKEKSFFDDFYNRVHLGIYVLHLGNVLSDQLYFLEIWNSFATAETLSSITQVDGTNVTLTLPFALPHSINPYAYFNAQLSISRDGPPTITGSFIFHTTHNTVTLVFDGQRSILWPFVPLSTYAEKREYLTDVLKAQAGEQRLALRDIPRTSLSYQFIFPTHEERVFAENLANTVVNNPISFPIWGEALRLTDLTQGQSVVEFDTSKLSLVVNGVIVFWVNFNVWESVQVLNITATSITLQTPLKRNYPTCFVAAVLTGIVSNGITINYGGGNLSKSQIDMTSTGGASYAANSLPMWQSLPVETGANVMSAEISSKFQREQQIVESEPGVRILEDLETYTRKSSVMNRTFFDKESFREYRKQLDYFNGREKAFWLSTAHPDLIPIFDSLEANAFKMIVEYAGWSKLSVYPIVIYGSRLLFVQVVSAADNLDGTETINFSAPITGGAVTGITKVSILKKVRLDSDVIEIKYSPRNVTTLKIPVIEVLA